MNDYQLLLDFVIRRSEPAFRQLVERHTPWLYSACLRRLHDAALAEDATQAVFLALAQKAPTLLRQTTLSPWLHQVAKYVTANILGANARRAPQNPPPPPPKPPPPPWLHQAAKSAPPNTLRPTPPPARHESEAAAMT